MTLVAGNSLIVTMPVMASGSTDDNLIEPYGDVLVWKKKIINGRLYKRLWNETKNRWETDWILV
jgi:ABC-type Fe2+-enterobactin transport system substrate-binding protein